MTGDTWGIPGPTFLAIYIAAAVVLIVATAVTKSVLYRGKTGTGYEHVTPDRAAYLNGGQQLALYSSLGTLRRSGAIGVQPDRTLTPVGPMPAGGSPLDTAVYNAAGKRLTAKQLPSDPWVRSALDHLRETLERSGLVLTAAQRRAGRLAGLPMLALVAVGVARYVAGTQNHKPTAFLFVAVAAVAVIGFVGLVRTPVRTKAGTAALAALRRQHAHLAPAHAPAYATYGAAAAGMGVALFGAASLYALDPAFAAEAEVQRNLASAGGTSGWSGGDSSGSSDGGGSSCGGGGCGGGCGG